VTEIDRLLIERACLQLVTDYCHLTDHGEAAKVAAQFTDDGVWKSGERVMSGREKIQRGFQKRQENTARVSRHVCTTARIEVLDADSARGCVYLTLYRHDGEPGRALSPLIGPAMVGEYHDEFRRTPEGWRFQRRELMIAFMSNEAANAS